MRIPMEDWLRGCVYHDGRHGYVTLPCDEVLKIADFIERLRADRKTDAEIDIHDLTDCDFCKDRNCKDCEGGKDEPQTDCAWK